MLLAMTMAPAHAQDMRVTPHNLTRQGGGAAAAQSEAGELCIFCHAPSAAQATVVPHWQRSLETSFAYPMYDDVGIGMAGRVGSHSLACLSCHDATQAELSGIPSVSADGIHPIGVPYRGALDGSPVPGAEYRPASSGIVDGKRMWWVSRGSSATRSRSDLPLFARRPAEGADSVPLIECGTCHDPHSPQPLFLRLANGGSQLCLTCHDK